MSDPAASPEPPAAPPCSLADRVVSATLAIAVAHGLAKLLGIVQWSVIGHYYGIKTLTTDAFVLAFEGIIWTVFLIGEESVGPAFLPVFTKAKDKDGEEKAWRFTSTLLNAQLLLLLLAVGALMYWPHDAIRVLTLGEEIGASAERAELAAHFLVWMAPSLFGLSVGSLTYMLLNGYKRFFWPAFADAALKGALVAGLIAGRALGLEAEALIVGVLAAGVTKLAVHVLALGPKFKGYRPILDFSDPHVRQFAVLVAPLIVGIVFAKVRDYFNNFYVLSQLGVGLLGLNSFGKKIFNALGWLVPYPLSIAMFPFLCDLVAKDDKDALGAFLTRASRMLLLVFMPLAAALTTLSVPLAQVLFQSGKVDAAAAAQAGTVNAVYCLVLPFYALEFIFMQAYFAAHRTISVSIIGIVFSSLSMAISYLGVVTYGLTGFDAVLLVAGGFTASRALKTMVLAAVLRWKGLPLFPWASTVSFLFRAAILTAACGLACLAAREALERVMPSPAAPAAEAEAEEATKTEAWKTVEHEKSEAAETPPPASGGGMRGKLRALPKLAVPGLAALVVFLIGCKLLRFEEFDEMIEFAKAKLKKRREKGKT
ncbi:MAG: hypothetical protein HS116_11630 [Planctomycetes bacterium]|nr:hypothetical protein [Planctomycetota bacterium]